MAVSSAPHVPEGYAFLRELGTGAYGKVYLCKEAGGRQVAVKAATAPKARRRTRKEGELLQSLKHPGILQAFATIEENETIFISTEYLSGGDLLHFMKERSCRPLPEPVARNLFVQLVAGVDYLHRAGIVHRDIKCENILLTADYQSIRLADFGFACPWSETELLHESLGSLHYASPEMCANTPYRGPEADIWSVGVVLYAILVGRLPFGGRTEEELSARIKEGFFHTPSTLPQLPAALLRWLLHPNATSRITMEKIKQHAWLTTPQAALEMPRSSSEPLPKARPVNANISSSLAIQAVAPAASGLIGVVPISVPSTGVQRNKPPSLPSVVDPVQLGLPPVIAPNAAARVPAPHIPASTPIAFPSLARRRPSAIHSISTTAVAHDTSNSAAVHVYMRTQSPPRVMPANADIDVRYLTRSDQ